MANDQLKGAAGVQLRVNDISGRPAGVGNKYRVGLVGWTPKGPSNQVVNLRNPTELYSIFGSPLGYSVDAVFALHNAKIMLDAGCEVQFVRAVRGAAAIGDTPEVTEKLNYGALNLLQDTKVGGAPIVDVPMLSTTIQEIVASYTFLAIDEDDYTSATKTLTGRALVVDGITLKLNDYVNVTGDATHTGVYKVTTLGTGSNGTWVKYELGNLPIPLLSGKYDKNISLAPKTWGGDVLDPSTTPYVKITSTEYDSKYIGFYNVKAAPGDYVRLEYILPFASTIDSGRGVSAISGNLSTDGSKSVYTLTPSADSASPFTAYMAYPGLDGYQMSVQTFEYQAATSQDPGRLEVNHTLNSPTESYATPERLEFYKFVLQSGLYATPYGEGSVVYGDLFNEYDGKFYTANGVTLSSWAKRSEPVSPGLLGFVENETLNELMSNLMIIRVYASATASTPVDTIYATIDDYIDQNGYQLSIDSVSSKFLLFRKNRNYSEVDYPLIKTATGSAVEDVWISASAPRTTLKNGEILIPTGTVKPKNLPSTTKNTSRTCFADAWKLFKDVSTVDVSMLVDGGSSIINFGLDRDNTGLESGDVNVVRSMLEVSSYRMDAPSIIDLPKTASAKELVKLFNKNYPSIGYEMGGSTAQYATYWGNAQDGRQLINDTFNRKQIECARSVFKALVAYNVFTTSVPWQTQWGPNRGLISNPSVASLNVRSFPDDVGLLSENRINPTKNTAAGEFFWDDYTMMAKSSVLQRWHAVCFLANLHKRYRTILEQYVAELNTPALRKAIFMTLNDDLNYIANVASPQGLYNYSVICDESNNPPEVIDAGMLNVDIGLEIARDTRVINLTTTLYRTGGIVESGIKLT